MDWVIIESAQIAFSCQLQNNESPWPRQHTAHSYPNRRPETRQQRSQRKPSSRWTALVRHNFSWITEVKRSPNSLCYCCVHVLSSKTHDVPFQTSLYISQLVPFSNLIYVIYRLRSSLMTNKFVGLHIRHACYIYLILLCWIHAVGYENHSTYC